MSDWTIAHEFDLPKNLELRELAGGAINPMMFEPPGPVGEGYVYGMEAIDYIMGPFGSAKTTCSVFRIPTFSLRMPVCKDDVIRVRGAVMHANFRALYRTGLESIWQFFPRDFPGATFEGGQDRPFKFTIRFMTPKGKKLQIILDGFGLGEHSIEELLRGYQANFAWMVEADLIPRKAPSFVYGRVAQGRYPGRGFLADIKASVPASVWGDMNPPLISHYIHDDFVEAPREGYNLRRQPSGLSEQAENRKYVPRETYEAMARTMAPDDVRRFVHGEFGLVGDGALVYPDFDYAVHVRKNLEPLDLPLRVGLDHRVATAVLGQYTPKGQLRVLDELVGEPNMSAGRFAELLIDLLQSKYRGMPISNGWGDPSGFYGADRAAGELSFMEIVGKAIGVNILPTPTNDPQTRQESVSWFLRRPSGGEPVPYFLIDAGCKLLIGGFQGGFVIALNPHESLSRVAFVKNRYSHPHEGLQYLAYGSRGHAGLINDAARAGRPGNVVPIRVGAKPNIEFNVP